ncbi:uncharacterized protein LOC110678888 [Aedes aegypti]|uniref:Uncharacterized protein n=1 Tax=Aedes aegypti TaxID=7159 RepID=A0A1S4FJ35_AEDAE|nr:uncharacterized protein LOC5570373 [Aedes aegypti]XP_021708161.1 uncharacterized protein LOC110678888 [Aedes aegypti]
MIFVSYSLSTKGRQMILLTLLGLFILGNNVYGCNIPTRHYTTMKCVPMEINKSGCPSRFECPSLTNHDNSKCYFNGKTYVLNEQVPQELVSPYCSALCYCRSGSPFAQFRCTHIDCAEFFHRFDYENCIRTYKPNSCCSSGSVCGDDKKKLAECTTNDESYLAGQRMHPSSDKCLTCICHSGFNETNITNDPNCYESICGFELFYAKHVYNGGAPVYYGDRCCPWEWRMPKDSDRLANDKTNEKVKDSTLQCKYGKLTMSVGDSLVPEVTDQYTYKCSCQIPPLAQCTMTKNNKE